MSVFESLDAGGVGVVLFDLHEGSDGKMQPKLGAGWASLSGGKAFRIQRYEDLSAQSIWITNLDKTSFWHSGCTKIKRLRESGYFKTDLGALMREIGATTQKMGPTGVVESLSEIYQRTVKLMQEHYQVGALDNGYCIEEIKPKLIPPDRSLGLEMDEVLSRSYTDFIVSGSKNYDTKKYTRITLRRPRLKHAQQVLETMCPQGDWELIASSQMPEQEFRLAWLESLGRPVLAQVNLKNFSEKCPDFILPLLQMGEAIGMGGRKKERNWMSIQELKYFSRFAKMEISSVFAAQGYKPIHAGKALLTMGELSDFSISLGLLAEMHWVSLSERSRHPQTNSKSMVSPRASWIRASDRFYCFTATIPLSSAGFEILGYGNGCVHVLCAKEKVMELAVMSANCGLLFPKGLLNY